MLKKQTIIPQDQSNIPKDHGATHQWMVHFLPLRFLLLVVVVALPLFVRFDGAGTSDSSDSVSALSPSDSTTLALPCFLDIQVPVPEPDATGANTSALGNDPMCIVGVGACWCEVGLIGRGFGMAFAGTGSAGSSTGGGEVAAVEVVLIRDFPDLSGLEGGVLALGGCTSTDTD
jgi:hypothetical protein